MTSLACRACRCDLFAQPLIYESKSGSSNCYYCSDCFTTKRLDGQMITGDEKIVVNLLYREFLPKFAKHTVIESDKQRCNHCGLRFWWLYECPDLLKPFSHAPGLKLCADCAVREMIRRALVDPKELLHQQKTQTTPTAAPEPATPAPAPTPNERRGLVPGSASVGGSEGRVYGGGIRYNKGKTRHALISPWAMEGLAKVLTYGEKKHTHYGECTCHRANELHADDCEAKQLQSGADNWRKGLSWRETIDSLKRHLTEIEKCNDIDEESGLPHIDLLQCNAMFLSEFFHLKRGTDDRWRPDKNWTNEHLIGTTTFSVKP